VVDPGLATFAAVIDAVLDPVAAGCTGAAPDAEEAD
jgi:hypothetical protein